jgi:hypothetical protein
MAHGQGSITSGPSKFDLMVSLFDANYTNRRTVTFMVVTPHGQSELLKTNQEIEVQIDGIEREDGSGENWNFHGYHLTKADEKVTFNKVKGYFSTRTLTGWVEWPELVAETQGSN